MTPAQPSAPVPAAPTEPVPTPQLAQPAASTTTRAAAKQEQSNANQLPQTGDQSGTVALAGLGLLGLTLSLFGLQKQRH